MWITKKALKNEVAELNKELAEMYTKYPFEFGQVVYDVQLKNNKGRFTKTKACREYSTISEAVVDKRNYFNLVDRLNNKDVFLTMPEAEAHLAEVCVD